MRVCARPIFIVQSPGRKGGGEGEKKEGRRPAPAFFRSGQKGNALRLIGSQIVKERPGIGMVGSGDVHGAVLQKEQTICRIIPGIHKAEDLAFPILFVEIAFGLRPIGGD